MEVTGRDREVILILVINTSKGEALRPGGITRKPPVGLGPPVAMSNKEDRVESH